MERSLYIIKPEAVAKRLEIRDIIIVNGLKIVSQKTRLLPEFIISQIYPNLVPDLYSATMHFLRFGLSELGIVEGENAISLLVKIGGQDIDPNKCEKDTIRNKFGNKEGVIWGDVLYFLNGFHRSSNVNEAIRDLELYNKC